MKHPSWIVALVIGLAIGFFGRGSIDGNPGRNVAFRPGQPQPQARPRPVEDPRAVYKVPVDGSPVRGPADALVTIVESSDFECPFCKRASPTMKQLEAAYAGKVRFVFKHNPLPFHAQALPAALAAEEARAQGGDEKFWAFHDAVFALPGAPDPAALEKIAGDLGLDVAKVKAAIAGKTHQARIDKDQKLVVGVGAPATPTFFINGRKLAGAQPFEAFRGVVDDELRKAEALVKAGTAPAAVYEQVVERGATAPVYVAGSAPQPGVPGAPAAAPAAPPGPAAPPPAAYAKIPLRPDDPARGPADAKLTVALFSDFQCPFCSRVLPSLEQLEQAFPGQVRVVWKHRPLPFHPNARPAALAAEAAREQGKFWPFHDRLFANQAALSAPFYESTAADLKLDLRKFKASLEGGKGAARVDEDDKLALSVDAGGTPTMFFNCRKVVGAQPFPTLRAVAEEELAKADALLEGAKPGADFYAKACDTNVAAAPAPAPSAAAPSGQGAQAALPPGALAVRADDPVRGNPKAPVSIVLFSDFQCPFCARVNPTLDEVQKTYGDKVNVVWKHQPLPFHPNALPAAEAAEAAREQGKFWPFHDKLFSNQQLLGDEAYQRYARELGLDVAKFDAARRSGKFRARIQEDQALGTKVGAGGTPTMFVNGKPVVGAVPFATLKAAVDEALAKK